MEGGTEMKRKNRMVWDFYALWDYFGKIEAKGINLDSHEFASLLISNPQYSLELNFQYHLYVIGVLIFQKVEPKTKRKKK